jgi:hypothetical protein
VSVLAWCGSGNWRLAWLRGGYPAMCESGAGLWPGTAQGAESLAEQSRGSADLQGRD